MSAAESQRDQIPNGAGAAAILAAGIGCAVLGILATAGDIWASIGRALNIYNPTGTLSGVTTFAIIIWLVAWAVLGNMWRGRNVEMSRVGLLSFVGLAIGFLLTFPPVMDVLGDLIKGG